MKVLWFTNNTVNLSQNIHAGAWMQSLERQLVLNENIQLSIATRVNGSEIRKIIKDKTIYFLAPDKRNLFQKRMDGFLNREPVDLYLIEYLKIIEEVQPDIIHVFGSEMDYGLICGFTDIPVVIHIQGILQPSYYQMQKIPITLFHHVFSQRMLDHIKGSTFVNNLKTFKRRLGVEKKIFEQCQYVLGRTNWDKGVIRILAPNAEYFHCDEMLRQDFFNATWKGNTTETINIVSIISNPVYKGHDTLVATCQVLKNAGVKFTWHVIGLDNQSSSYAIFYKKQMYALEGCIQLHGCLPPEQIVVYLENADVYVHPSHIENSSNSLCEAMALGMPVIALDVGGNSSILTHNMDGIIVPDNDPYFLSAILMEFFDNKTQYKCLADNAKKTAIKRHNPDKIISNLVDIYNEIIVLHENKK